MHGHCDGGVVWGSCVVKEEKKKGYSHVDDLRHSYSKFSIG